MSASLILNILDLHVQSARNQRCECGWRPRFPQSQYGSEGTQHRVHLAEVLAIPFGGISGTRREVAATCIGITYGPDNATQDTADACLRAADAVMFSHENIAAVVQRTGLSLQTVTEVARELRNA